jgi:hypothetical protein
MNGYIPQQPYNQNLQQPYNQNPQQPSSFLSNLFGSSNNQQPQQPYNRSNSWFGGGKGTRKNIK